MHPASQPPDSPATDLSGCSKSELLTRLAALPCAPRMVHEDCPGERLILELSTHRVELDAQNQELRESQQYIEEARDRYSDLYDFAPVGYLTLGLHGCIREINLTGSDMLGCERGRVLGKPLILWLARSSHTAYLRHLGRVFGSRERVVDDLLLRDSNGAQHHINMTSIVIAQGTEAGQFCRSVLVDITPLKDKEKELTHSREQLRNLTAHLDQVREDERRHLAREIHDELGQKLTALRFEVAMLWTRETTLTPSAIVGSLLKQIDETIASVRVIASDLRPAVLDLGLASAVEWQVQEFRRRTGIACELTLRNMEFPLNNARSTAVFRILQESLTNILRHASASQVQLRLERHDDTLEIEIQDNGVGITTEALDKPRSFGLAGIRERVRLLGADMHIRSHPGAGTTLHVSIPLRERRTGGRNTEAQATAQQGEQ